MYSTDHYSNGFLATFTRPNLPPIKPPPFYRGYPIVPRREESWSRSEPMSRQMYPGGNQGIPGPSRSSVIPQRFEHRMIQEGMNRPPVSNWRPPQTQDRSVTLRDTEPKERVVYRPKHHGLKTSDLSHRLGIPNRSCKPMLPNESSPRSVHLLPSPQRVDRKVSAKERLTLPSAPPQVERKPEQTVNKKMHMSPQKPVRKLASHVRSTTQNDPRLKSGSGEKTPPPQEHKKPATPRKSIGQFLGRVRQFMDPETRFFDEDTSQKEEAPPPDYQDNFDVPLPPSAPAIHISTIPNEETRKKSVENTNDSFWDETDDIPTESLPLLFTEPPLINKPQIETEPAKLQPAHSTQVNNNNVTPSPFFDDEFIQQSQPNGNLKKSSHHHNRNINKHRRRNETKSKRHNRSDPTRHGKHPHKRYHSHSPNKPIAKSINQSPGGLITDSNSPLLKMKTHTHIRLKKTVNLGDHSPVHSSSEDESQELVLISQKLHVPLPTSPLPLNLIPSPDPIPIPLHTCDLSNNFCEAIEDFNLLQSQENSQTRDETGIALAVEVPQTHEADLPNESHKNTIIITESDDIIAKSPQDIELLDSTPIIESPSLTEEFKSFSPKSDLQTPDSVFNIDFNSSQSPCIISSAESPILSIDFSDLGSSKRVKLACKDKIDLSGLTRKPVRKPKNSRPDSDHSFSNTREVCIPLTKLDVTQYGGKVKSTSEPPVDKLASKEKQIIKVFSQWKCMFCHKGANEKNLGYLYGPYFKTGENLKLTPLPLSARRKASKEIDEAELWVHAPCALWTPGVLMVSFHLSGLIEAYDDSISNACTECGNSGATLSCEHEGCTNKYHYVCAETINCRLNHEYFKLQCPLHDQQNHIEI